MYLLESEVYAADKDRCLKFWYHMYGSGIGSLTVYRQFSGGPSIDLLWQKTGSQDNIWRMGRANLNKLSKSDLFSIFFQGQKGKSDTGNFKQRKIKYCFLIHHVFDVLNNDM